MLYWVKSLIGIRYTNYWFNSCIFHYFPTVFLVSLIQIKALNTILSHNLINLSVDPHRQAFSRYWIRQEMVLSQPKKPTKTKTVAKHEISKLAGMLSSEKKINQNRLN